MEIENRDLAQATPPRLWEGPEGFLSEAYEAHRARFEAQPAETRQAVELEARRLGDMLSKTEPVWRAAFMLPEHVAVGSDKEIQPVPDERRLQHVGTWMDRLRGRTLRATLRDRFLELDQSSVRTVATSAKLIRHATAWWMIHRITPLPQHAVPTTMSAAALSGPDGDSGHPQHLAAGEEGERDWDGQAQEHLAAQDLPNGSFSVPAWVAFDQDDNLLVDSPAQAESFLAMLQDALAGLRAAISLAPYLIADDVYQAKRAGLLVQLGEQGRALARYETRQIISTLERRASAGQLNRGLKVSLPYYDDQALRLVLRTFEVIPAGRIMFVAALGVRAVQDEQAKVAQDTRLSPATRDHLLEELEMLKRAFRDPTLSPPPSQP
jgi:hypothetical protein